MAFPATIKLYIITGYGTIRKWVFFSLIICKWPCLHIHYQFLLNYSSVSCFGMYVCDMERERCQKNVIKLIFLHRPSVYMYRQVFCYYNITDL